MAWVNPKNDYTVSDGLTADDLNVRANDLLYLKTETDKIGPLATKVDELPIALPNLIRNSSAEYGTWGDTSGWYAYTAAGEGGQYFSAIARTGDRSLKLMGSTSNFDGLIHTKSSVGGGYLKVKPGTKYVLSAYVKTENVAGTGAYIRYRDATTNRGDVVTDKRSAYVTGTQDWTRLTLEFYPTAELIPTYPFISVGLIGTGSVWFDDIKLEEEKLSPYCVEMYDQLVGKEIMESGSNANGAYIKFADRTMICYMQGPSQTTSEKFGVGWKSPGWTWTFPVAFVGVPKLLAVSANHTMVSGGGTSYTAAIFTLYSLDSAGRVGNPYVYAIGQWI